MGKPTVVREQVAPSDPDTFEGVPVGTTRYYKVLVKDLKQALKT
jgi:hypothetical protein